MGAAFPIGRSARGKSGVHSSASASLVSRMSVTASAVSNCSTRGQREDLHVDASGIPLGDPSFADVAQVAHQPFRAAADLPGLFLEIAARTLEKASVAKCSSSMMMRMTLMLRCRATCELKFPKRTRILRRMVDDFQGEPEALPTPATDARRSRWDALCASWQS
jgi:hypothetical protein